MLNKNQNLLVIDDDQEIWKAYKKVLEYRSIPETSTGKQLAALLVEGRSKPDTESSIPPRFELSFASQGQSGYTMLKEAAASGTPFSVAFIDIRMPPGWDGMETAARIRQIDPNIEIVIVTAYTDRSREEIVRAVGAPDKLLFLRKPFDPEELFQLALSLSEKWRLGRMEAKARVALSESEARFRSLVETTPDFVWEMDIEGKFTYCSPACEMIYDFRPDELLGHTFFDKLLPQNEVEDYRKSFKRGLEEFIFLEGAHEYCCQNKDGTEVHIESSAAPIINEQGQVTGFRGIDRNVSERHKILAEKNSIEEQYRQAQKMEALGTLAGGIAHDLNNLLTPIIGYAEMNVIKSGPNSPLSNELDIIIKSAKKAADLISQILIFSRKKTLTPEVFELNAIIQDCIKMLSRMIREDIELHFQLVEKTWSIFIDKGQIEQVLINLVVNARDAINGNGTIVVSTTNISIPPDQELTDVNLSKFSGNYVVLAVSDTGSGIEPEIMEKIFDPFYTTKEVGKGTGLGLATVYGVIHQFDGHIIIDSAQEQGTTFYLYLPRSQKEAQLINEPKSTATIGGSELILVVEDDPAVRELTVLILQQLGYHVIYADNGLSAMVEFDNAGGDIDLLISDVIMPLQSGDLLAATIREKRPDLPILFFSGYPKDMAPQQLLESANTSFMRKPFDASILAERVREMLDHSKHHTL